MGPDGTRRLALRAVMAGSRWIVFAALAVVVILAAGIAIAAAMAGTADVDVWRQRSDVGESFGALNSVFSGLALGAVVITFWVQFRELQSQRTELTMQREALAKSQEELHRSAEAHLRRLHVDLLAMAIHDADLAAVWPPFEAGLPHERTRQYLYANLIFQHARTCLEMGIYPESQVDGTLRHLFSSPVMREYWRAATYARSFLPPGTPEYQFSEIAEKICREYETVLANNHGDPARRPKGGRQRTDAAEVPPSRAA